MARSAVTRAAAGLALAALTSIAPSVADAASLFARPVTYSVGSQDPTYLAAGDLNGDGIPDLAVGLSQSGIAVLDGGTFTRGAQLSTSAPVTDLAIADALGNGHQDVVALERNLDDVVIFPGNGSGTFGNPIDVPVPAPPAAVAVGDLNGDGIPDLVAVGTDASDHGQVYVMLGQGDGQFGAPTPIEIGAFGAQPQAVAIAKLTNTNEDIVTANDDGTVSVLLGDGHGGFASASPSPDPGGAPDGPGSLAVANLSTDGIPDLLVANLTDIVPLIGTGSGTFTAGTPVPATGQSAIAVGDFSGDGIPDIAASDGSGGVPSIYPGLGGGRFGAALANPFYSGGMSSAGGLVAADFNGDGKTDLALTVSGYGVGEPTGVDVLLNDVGVPQQTPELRPITKDACYVYATVRHGRGAASVPVEGSGFPAGDSVQLHADPGGFGDTYTVAPSGTFEGSYVPFLRVLSFVRPTRIVLSGVDRQESSLSATTSFNVVPFWMQSSDSSEFISEHARIRFRFSGFAPGAGLYEHYVFKGKVRKTVEVARVTGACGLGEVSILWAVRHPRHGTWVLQFDDSRRYSPHTPGRWSFAFRPGAP